MCVYAIWSPSVNMVNSQVTKKNQALVDTRTVIERLKNALNNNRNLKKLLTMQLQLQLFHLRVVMIVYGI